MKPHNEVLKYFMSRKLHTNTGSPVFLTKGRSLCCGAAGTDGCSDYPQPENLQFLHFVVTQTCRHGSAVHAVVDPR